MPLRFQPARGASVVISASSRGPTGTAATIAVGTVTRLAEGATPTVTNTGTSAAAVFAFGLPPGSTPAIGFTFNTATTDSDKDAGDCWFNSATPASVTVIYFDNADRDANTVTTWLDSFDDSTSTHNGTLVLTPALTPAAKLVYSVTGSVVDGTGYRKVTVTHVSGTTLPSDNAHIAVEFSRTGDAGEVSGPGATVDSEITLWNGASGTSIKRATGSGLVVANSGVYTGPRTLTGTANQVTVTNGDGTAGNPTISLPADVIIPTVITAPNTGLHILDTNASHDLVIVPGSDLSADRNLTLTTGDAARTVTISGNATISQDYSSTGSPTFANPLVTTVELGHASDTTLSRASAGVAAVEGKTIAVLSTAQEFTATQNFNATTLTDAATIAWDLAANQVASVTLGGNRTLGAPTNIVDGATYILTVKQDGTGSRTLSWNAAYKFPGGTDPVLSTGANDVDVITFVSDGTSLFGVASKDFS